MSSEFPTESPEAVAVRLVVENKALKARVAALEAKNTELEKLVGRDVLTGLYNRFAFEEQMAREIVLSKRNENQFVGLLLIDANRF